MIAAALVFGDSDGVASIAIGFVIGSALRVLVLLPGLRSLDFRWRSIIGLDDEHLRSVLRLVPALVVGYAIADVNGLVDRLVGSQQETTRSRRSTTRTASSGCPTPSSWSRSSRPFSPHSVAQWGPRTAPASGEPVTKGLQVMTIALAPLSVLLFCFGSR